MIIRAQKNATKYNKNVKQCRRVRRTKKKKKLMGHEKNKRSSYRFACIEVWNCKNNNWVGGRFWHEKFKPSRIWTKRIAMEQGGREPTTQHHAVHTYIHAYIHTICICIHTICICLLCILPYCHLYVYIHHWVVLNTFFWKYFKL
jgi:hypothetical protein